MKAYESSSTIAAAPDAIWAIITDGSRVAALTYGVERWNAARIVQRGSDVHADAERRGTTGFRMREEYTGPLLPHIWKSIPDLGPSFEQYANGLKQEAERAR